MEPETRQETLQEAVQGHEKTSKLAFVLGSLYGDGCFYKEKSPNRGVRVIFGSCDIEYVEKVSQNIYDLFGIKLNIRKTLLSKKNPRWRDFYSFSTRKLYKKLSRYIPSTKNVPEFVKKSDSTVKASFLRGFFDAEGGVDIHIVKSRNALERHICCHSSDLGLLKGVQRLLEDVGMQSLIYPGKRAYRLTIWNHKNLKQFKKNVGFTIFRKEELLTQALKSYKSIQTPRWDGKTRELVISIRKSKKSGAKKIKNELSVRGINVPQPTIESWIYRGNNKK